jgi:cell wall-associated NlpC family hydrolase
MPTILPACWTAAIEQQALAHAREAYPHEAAGVIAQGAYVRLDNRSQEPRQDVVLSGDDLVRVAEADAFFHSHPDGIGCPSAQDMIYQQQLGIPFVILVLPIFDLFAFGDQLPRQPLIGRGFRHGVHDCYALIRDWFVEARGIALPDQPRDWGWWSNGLDLYTEHFPLNGFVAIPPAEATQQGDLLLFAFNYKVPMHGAIVMPPDLMLHHPAGIRGVDPTRLSGLVPRARFAHLVTVALRHA